MPSALLFSANFRFLFVDEITFFWPLGGFSNCDYICVAITFQITSHNIFAPDMLNVICPCRFLCFISSREALEYLAVQLIIRPFVCRSEIRTE